ncbi:hypothetical protein CGRA01v4_04711 [Colletotrichum graminicola]|nr:hypothetical protein CGRA01v4_04711 [Colletotrichum graminicola]
MLGSRVTWPFFCLSCGSSWATARKTIGKRVLTAITTQSKAHILLLPAFLRKQKRVTAGGGVLHGSTGELILVPQE